MSVKINNWYIKTKPIEGSNDVVKDNEDKVPGTFTVHLSGNVEGHVHFPNGSHITTSAIMKMTKEGLVTTQSGTMYQLGEAAQQYKDDYPDPVARLKICISQMTIANERKFRKTNFD